MNLKALKNESLLIELRNLVQEEKKLIKHVLEYLEEVEVRKLYLDRGFSSMFAFCVEYLGYTEHEAQIRIQAMRLAKTVPEVKTQIESGALSLTVAAKVQGHIAKENKIKRETKKSPVTTSQAKCVVESLQNKSVKQSEKILFELFPHHAEKMPEVARTVSADTIRVEMNLSRETLEKLKKLQALRAHAHGNQDFESIIKDLCELGDKKWNLERQEKPKHNPVINSKKPQNINTAQLRSNGVDNSCDKRNYEDKNYKPKNNENGTAPKNSRYVPVLLKRQIWRRDQGVCQYRDKETGRVCLDRFGLQLDHIKPFALNGEHSQENLRLVCWKHNAHRAQKTFGKWQG